MLHSAWIQTQERVKLGLGDEPSAGLYSSQSGTSFLVRPATSGMTVEGVKVGARPMTWTVLGEAVRALEDIMKEHGRVGCTFVIHSGPNLVGQGSVRI